MVNDILRLVLGSLPDSIIGLFFLGLGDVAERKLLTVLDSDRNNLDVLEADLGVGDSV